MGQIEFEIQSWAILTLAHRSNELHDKLVRMNLYQ
jgi:hypothetical protein